MTTKSFFFDTFAILEIINGTETYKPYVDSIPVITKLNLFELFHALNKMHGKEKANFYMSHYKQFVKDFDETDIEAGSDLKLKNNKMSMTDCIGYVVALKSGIKFLTGDNEFENMPNVEFVK